MSTETDKAMKLAADVQARNRLNEKARPGGYSDDEVRMSTVHAREDIAAIFVMQGQLHKQLVSISRGVWVLVILVAGIAFQIAYPG